MSRLTGQVAIVTGAGSGMGREIARALAQEGASLALIGRRSSPLAETAALVGGTARTFAIDVAQWDAVERTIATIARELGRIDILVNNAGTNTRRRSWKDAEIADWDVVVRTNLDGVFFTTRAVLPTMRSQGSGLIVNISSLAGRSASVISGAPYSASKHGVVALTQSVNLEEWRHGIRAACIEPGEVATPILEFRPEVPPRETWSDMLQPEDIAETVRFIATLPSRVLVDEIAIRPRVRRLG